MSQSSPHSGITIPSSDLGRKGEELAAAYLQHHGFQIVAANFAVPVGRNRIDAVVNVEIDLVAYEGPILCFVEVKTRMSDWFALPTANVDLRKQRQIIRAARVYRRMFGLAAERSRFDVVSIVLQPAAIEVVEEDTPLRPEQHVRKTIEPGGSTRGIQIELLRNFWSEEKFRKRRPGEEYWY